MVTPSLQLLNPEGNPCFFHTCIHQSGIPSMWLSAFLSRVQVLLTTTSAASLVHVTAVSHLDCCHSLVGRPVFTLASPRCLLSMAASMILLKCQILSSGQNPSVASHLSQWKTSLQTCGHSGLCSLILFYVSDLISHSSLSRSFCSSHTCLHEYPVPLQLLFLLFVILFLRNPYLLQVLA